MHVTCHTEGCWNAGHSIALDFPDVDGEPVVPDSYVCGVCGVQITDVTADATE